MTSPFIQAEGAIAAVTTGNLVITLPSYAADDIVVINTVGWVPNTTTGQSVQSLSSPWTKIFEGIYIDLTITDGEVALWWARATSNSSLGTTVTITRPTNWDTGNDTCWAGRAYVIRDCITNGNPYDNDPVNGTPGTFEQVDVNGGDRLVVQFWASPDNLSAGAAPSPYSAGTAVTTNTGTDAGFQTFYITSVSGGVAAVTNNETTPAQGYNYYAGVAFRPPNPRYILIS